MASQASPAIFSIAGASSGTACTAVESPVPSGYTAQPTDCQNGDPLNGFCTIINILDAPPQEGVILSYDFEREAPMIGC